VKTSRVRPDRHPLHQAEEAILGAQIITTVTADKQYATILTDNMVGAGVHINGVGGDCPGKTELTATSCCAPRSSSNTRPRPASRARSSSFPPTTR
jgi:ornithine cyclodeaminase/alanine dehydrogenase-like protein (mu-crystallin family)